MADTFVTVERGDDGVAVIRLDRPKANALSAELLVQLAAAARGLSADPPGAVVVWGGEKIFAAGADISEFTVDGAGEALVGPAAAMAISEGFREALDAIAAIPRLTIAAVTRFALGGGCELALACDLRVCGASARFGQPEILLGIIPGGGGTQRLARLIGPARAKDMILTGRQVGAEEALAFGLVDRVVADDEVFTAAHALAGEAARGPVLGHAMAKRAIDEGLDGALAAGLSLESELFGQVFATADATAGVRSFLAQGPGRATFSGA